MKFVDGKLKDFIRSIHQLIDGQASIGDLTKNLETLAKVLIEHLGSITKIKESNNDLDRSFSHWETEIKNLN